MNRRTMKTIQPGAMLRDAIRLRGRAMKTARKVPHRAICTVSHIWPARLVVGWVKTWVNDVQKSPGGKMAPQSGRSRSAP